MAGTATVDFFMTSIWEDPRFDMPIFWEKMDPVWRSQGIRINKVLYDSAGLFFWTPDLYFIDGMQSYKENEDIFLNASNVLTMSTHYTVKFAESLYEFENFPYDEQMIVIRYGSFGFNASLINMVLLPGALTYVTNFNGEKNIYFNNEFSYNEQKSLSTILFTRNDHTEAVYILPMDRYANGLILRIFLPIVVLVCLAAMTFWITAPEVRVAASASLLIATAALYIITIKQFPLVGNETAADKFVLTVCSMYEHMIMSPLKDMVVIAVLVSI
jgi:hypothetical protein